jgi:hypothetical protein
MPERKGHSLSIKNLVKSIYEANRRCRESANRKVDKRTEGTFDPESV